MFALIYLFTAYLYYYILFSKISFLTYKLDIRYKFFPLTPESLKVNKRTFVDAAVFKVKNLLSLQF